jgi:membrane-bound lytic murein transglycosylase B
VIPPRPLHRSPRRLPSVVLACLALAAPVSAPALDESRPDVRAFIADVSSRHGFDAAELSRTFAQVESRPSILAAIAKPAERTLTWDEYRARFITDRRISRGIETGQQHAAALDRAAAGGVPAEVILAITGVETFYGENTGKHRVIDALATLAFDYPRRSDFFRRELEQFLLMARTEALDPLAPLGSYAGAMGIPQFMPSSFLSYAVDGDGDGHRDLWNDWADVFASVGNYLSVHGWRAGEPVMAAADASGARLDGVVTDKLDLAETVGSLRDRGVRFSTALPADAPAVLLALPGASGPEYRVGFRNYYAITRYNRSALYASAVNDLAEALGAARNPTNASTGFSDTVSQ